jgi:8-oxo-dGTP pyrophosphatase MutT (NUDIX family)
LGNNNSWIYNQSGVIPFRYMEGKLWILLISSSSGKRWIIPKGIIEPGLSPPQSASQEAYEEAGIRGEVLPRSFGTYKYKKWGGICTVEVFLLEVRKEYTIWPEGSLRKRQWVTPRDAEKLLDGDGLKEILKEAIKYIYEMKYSDNSVQGG